MSDLSQSTLTIPDRQQYPQCESDRLLLRQFQESDLPGFYEIFSDPKTMHFMNGPRDCGRTRQSLQTKVDHWQRHGYGIWCLETKRDSVILGHCGLGWLPPLDKVEVSYLIRSDYWGRGYATEAVRTALDYGFGPLGLAEIVAITHPDHLASRRVMAKVGMRYWKRVTVWDNEFVCYRDRNPVDSDSLEEHR